MYKLSFIIFAILLFLSCGGASVSESDYDNQTDDNEMVTGENDSGVITDTYMDGPDRHFEYPDDPGEQQYAAVIADTGRESDFAISDTAGNGENIVTDSATGLIWQQVLPTVYAGCVKVDTTGLSCTWTEAINYCRSLKYGGFDDWQLPTPHELITIVDYGRRVDQNNPVIYSEAFSNMPIGNFWTSLLDARTPSVFGGYNAWIVNFIFGRVSDSGGGQNFGNKVMCVRRDGKTFFGGTKYVETTASDGKVIVTDNLTKLEWTKEYVGDKAIQEAIDYCSALTYGDKQGWRLPGVNELRSLIDYTKYDPASNFPGMAALVTNDRFWASQAYSGDTTYSWFLGFNTASLEFMMEMSSPPPYYLNVRCVR